MKKVILFVVMIMVFSLCSGSGFADELQEQAAYSDLQTYPLNVGLDYYRAAVSPPDIVYNTLGSENGLAGLICVFEGVVEEVHPLNAAGVPVEYAIVRTDRGLVLILNMYQGVYEETVLRFGKETAREIYSDNADYYTFPPIGEKANFLTIYDGYSTAEDMPAFQYGASADVFAIEEFEDPVAKRLETLLK